MLNVKTYKKLVVNCLILGLLQMELGIVSSLFTNKAFALTATSSTITDPSLMSTPTATPNSVSCQVSANGVEDPNCKGINTTTEDWVDAANRKKQEYTLPPSEIERLKKQAARNEQILKDNEKLINSFYSALSSLGIDAMEEATANIELLTAKLKTDTAALVDHTTNKLKPAIADFNSASNIPLVPPIGGMIGGLAWAATGPKAMKETKNNSKLSNKVYDSSNELWKGIDDMVAADSAAYQNAMKLAQQTKSDAINLLKTSVNDSFELTKDATQREFATDMVTNTDILGTSTAACLDLDCSNLGDAFSVSYHLFKAASAVYLSTTVRLISAYNENQADIMKSTPNEEGKFDTQTEQAILAENIRGESVDFGDKIKAAKTVLEAMWARVLEVAELEVRQKEAREAAEEAQASPDGDGAAPALQDSADSKDDNSDKQKKWILYLGGVALAGYILCQKDMVSAAGCGSLTSENWKTYAMTGAMAVYMLYQMMNSNEDKDDADDATQNANDAGAGDGGGSGAPDSALHAKLFCNAAGNNLYVSDFDLMKFEKSITSHVRMVKKIKKYVSDFSIISDAMASGKKITTALGLVDGSDIYSLFARTKVTQASKMSMSFGEPESRVTYLSGVVELAAKGASESDSMTNPNLAENKNQTGSLSDDMKIFGDKKGVDSKTDDITTKENVASNETANLGKSGNISGMATTGTLGKLNKSKIGSSMTPDSVDKTRGVKGGDYLRSLAGKLNALGENMKNKRDAHREKLGLKPVSKMNLAQNTSSAAQKGQGAQDIQVIQAGGSNLGGLINHLENSTAKNEAKKPNVFLKGNDGMVEADLPDHPETISSGLDGNSENGNSQTGTTGNQSNQVIDEKEILDMDQYNKEIKSYEIKEDDSIWAKLTKTYQKFGYPILMKRKQNPVEQK